MEIVLVIVALAVQGLLVGALGRFAVPGPNPMGIGQTIVVGIAGSLLGGLVGLLVFDQPGGLFLGVLGAALIVWALEQRRAPAARS